MIHIAVLLRPYLDLILSGEKTVECRLTRQARDPFERIEPGERIYFKQSAGPYAATAVAEHVLFERDLTPRRVSELRRDYNDLVCGDDSFWKMKRESRFATFVWLGEVQRCDSGPAIRPLQGVAWLALAEDPAWRRIEAPPKPAASPSPLLPALDQPALAAAERDGRSFAIEVTAGNLRNHSLYLTRVIDRFPAWALGGANRREAAAPLTLILHQGPTIETDIVAPRKMLRTRVWRAWFADHGVRAGDRVVFTPMDESTYFVGLTRRGRP